MDRHKGAFTYDVSIGGGGGCGKIMDFKITSFVNPPKHKSKFS